MDKIYEELEEVKAENEKLKEDFRIKTEISENLKKAHNEQVIKIQEANSKIVKQTEELDEKTEEISRLNQTCEALQSSLHEKGSIIKSVSAANDMLRVDCEENYKKWEEENRNLLLTLDESHEKNIVQEQRINVLVAEVEGLKRLLSALEKKCMESEKKAKAHNELRERDDMLLKLEEEHEKVEDQLKWKKEQFNHLEEAHGKLRDQFKTSKKEWEMEKCTLLGEICSLQTSLDSQTRISKDLEKRLEMCNQALAHEETQRRFLEGQVSEANTRYETVFAECEDTKSQMDGMTAQRDEEIAALRQSLGINKTSYKEMEYRAGKLEQENHELLLSLKELREAGIQGTGSSVGKIRNKLKNLEQVHRNCSANQRAKEAEWNTQLEEMTGELNSYRSQLESKDAAYKELEMELEACCSSAIQLKLHNEEISVIILVLKSAISEAQSNTTNFEADMDLCLRQEEQKLSLLMIQLEMKNAAQAKAQRDVEEERQKTAFLSKRVELLDLVEDQKLQMQTEIQRYKEMLEESSRCQHQLKEQALQMECQSEKKLKEVYDALEATNRKLDEERERVASLLKKVKSFDLMEEQQHSMQTENLGKMLEESSREVCESKQQLAEVCDALDSTNLKLAKEQEKTESLMRKVEESSRCQSDSERKFAEVSDCLERANDELVDKTCETHQIEFESWLWKSIAERLKVDLEENQTLRKELEASLLAQVDVGLTIKQEKDRLVQTIEDKDSRIGDLQQKIDALEKELKIGEQEADSSARTESGEDNLKIRLEKQEMIEDLQKEIELLEQESLRRELEGAVFAHIGAEKAYAQEKKTLCWIVEQKDQKIDELHELVKSLERNFNSSRKSFSLELSQKQAEIEIFYQAWEKIASAEILAQVEVEEKKLMIIELEDDVDNIQQKVEMQERSLSHWKLQVSFYEAEMEATQLEAKKLTYQMQAKLKTSDTLLDKVNCEKGILLKDIMKLSSERENLLCFIGGLADMICKFSNEDMLLMGALGKIVQTFDSGSDESLKGESELFDPVKENNMNTHGSPTTKRIESPVEDRSPFRQLN